MPSQIYPMAAGLLSIWVSEGPKHFWLCFFSLTPPHTHIHVSFKRLKPKQEGNGNAWQKRRAVPRLQTIRTCAQLVWCSPKTETFLLSVACVILAWELFRGMWEGIVSRTQVDAEQNKKPRYRRATPQLGVGLCRESPCRNASGRSATGPARGQRPWWSMANP